jgi:HSP20 family protein
MSSQRLRFIHSMLAQAARMAPDAVWRPSTDIYRTRQGWLVKFDLAGVRPEDVQLSAGGSTLTVRGRRRDWCVAEDCRCYQMEISYSDFERSVTLPCQLDQAHIAAEHREGMLLVRIQIGEDR